jgi:hypothetical protein
MYAVVAGAVIAAGAAYASSEAQGDATKKASEISSQAGARADATTREMFNRQLEENQPYKNVGLRGLAQYQSAILGGKVDYADPSYMQLSSDEVEKLNVKAIADRAAGGEAYFAGKDAKFFTKHVQRNPNDNKYDPTKKYYRAADGTITDKVPTLSAEYDYKASPSLVPQTRAYNRALASRGLSGSGQAATGVADLANADYSAQMSRLSGLAGIGQNAASANSGAAAATGASLSNMYTNQGTQQAGYALQQGQTKSGLYSDLGTIGVQSITNATKLK